MPLEQQFSFRYKENTVSINAERSNLGGALILNAISSWSLKDSLNKLKSLTVNVVKSDVDLNGIYFERECYVPAFKFRGIITGLIDIDDQTLQIVIQERAWHFTRRIYKIEDEFKEYTVSIGADDNFKDFVQTVIDSANADMPFVWKLDVDEDIETTVVDFDVKWKNYYTVLKQIAVNSLNDIWFENSIVFIGSKGKRIVLDRDDKVYRKLSTKIDLDTFGNMVTVVGAKNGAQNLYASAEDPKHELSYNYERVISNNNLKSQDAVESVKERILGDFNNIVPDVNIDISNEIIGKYKMESGDTIKISANSETQTVRGYYRLIEIILSNSRSSVKLQFSRDGKFLPRISDSFDILEAALLKIQDIELNS